MAMDPPEDYDPNQGWYQKDGRWIPLQLPRPAEPEEATTSQGSGAVNPESRPIPRPRPAYRGAYTPGTAPPPSPSMRPNFNFPPTFSTHPTVPTFSAPPPIPTPPPTQQFAPFTPPFLPSSDSRENVHNSHPAGYYPPYLQSDPSSRENSPVLAPSASSARPPTQTAVPLSAQKPDKGKKRASAPAAPAPPAPKKAKPAVTTKPAAAAARKAKGKAPMKSTSRVASHTGRQPGSSNYNDDDIDELLNLVERELPIGQTSWQRVTDTFNDWARENARPPRTHKPLKTKYESLVRTPKPTGSASVPANVERAWQIEEQISERVHLGVLDDSEIADANEEVEEGVDEVKEDADDSDIEIIEPPRKGASARKAAGQPVVKAFRDQGGASAAARGAAPTRRAQAQEFMTAVAASLDPAARDARDDTRYARRLAHDELQRLSQDNRDLRARNDSLTDRLQQQMAEASRLQARLDMLEMMQTVAARRPAADEFLHCGRPVDRWDHDDSPRRRPPYSHISYHSTPHSFSRTHAQTPPRRYVHSLSPPLDYLPATTPTCTRARSPVGRQTADLASTGKQELPPSASTSRPTHASFPTVSMPAPFAPSLGRFTATPVLHSATGTGLNALADTAIASDLHGRQGGDADDAASITLTYTPSCRRREQQDRN